jgi:hypothetical protein
MWVLRISFRLGTLLDVVVGDDQNDRPPRLRLSLLSTPARMRLLSWLWLLCTLAVSCVAIHESDVGVTDWYKQLIGRPFTLARVTAPKFLSEDLLVTTTSSNVLAAISAKDGSVGAYLETCEGRLIYPILSLETYIRS